MSSFEATVYSLLTGYGGLTALVGTRVYPEVVPQEATMPCVVYKRVSTPRTQGFGSTQPIITSRPRFQFDAWAATAVSAADIIEQVRAALASGSNAVSFDNELVMRDPESTLHRRILDAFIAHSGA